MGRTKKAKGVEKQSTHDASGEANANGNLMEATNIVVQAKTSTQSLKRSMSHLQT